MLQVPTVCELLLGAARKTFQMFLTCSGALSPILGCVWHASGWVRRYMRDLVGVAVSRQLVAQS